MKKIVYLLLLLSICLIPKTTFAATKINASNENELREAMESTTDNEITLVNDIDITYDTSLEDEENYLIVSDGNHILNLNNHYIKTESTSRADYGIITVLGGSLEIKGNGQVFARNVVLSVMTGTLKIDGGTYISGNENVQDIVLMTYSGKIIVNKGTFTGSTYSQGPESNGNNGPSQGSSLPILSSNIPATVNINRNNASKKLGDPLDTKPAITINEGTFNSTTYVHNTDLTINGGSFNGENGVEVSGSNSSLKINDGNISGAKAGLMVNSLAGDPTVQLAGGTYSCTEYNDQEPSGGITMGTYEEQKDGKGILNNLLAKNATIDDDTTSENTKEYGATTRYYYYTNKTVKVTSPVQQEENNKPQQKEITNPETSDNILISIIALISSVSMILISTKKFNNN